MTTKADYTEEEWAELVQAPLNVGMLIITADIHLTSLVKEMKGMLRGMVEMPAPQSAEELIGSLLEEIKAMSENKEKMGMPDTEGKDPEAIKEELLQAVFGAAAVVEAKGGAEESNGYKQWLAGVAEATAEAGKEGGFLGIGAVRVSEKEKIAMQQLSAALGLAG